MNSNGLTSNERVLEVLDELPSLIRNSPPAPASLSIAQPSLTPDRITDQQGRSTLSLFRQSLPSGVVRSPLQEDTRLELARAFQPYPSTSRGSVRGNSRPDRASGARILSPATTREWAHAFFCLTNPTAVRTPSLPQKVLLESNGFGGRVIRIAFGAGSNAVETAVRTLYPKLNAVSFELMKAVGGGAGQLLTPVMTEVPVPTVDQLRGIMARSVVYIRPTECVMERDDDPEGTRQRTMSLIDREDSHDYNLSQPASEESEAPHTRVNALVGGQELPSSLDDTAEAVLTMDDLRRQVYAENDGVEHIFVQRDDFAMQVLGAYKRRDFSLLKKPQVIFAGESGTDVGALQKEFFWQGMRAFVYQKYDGKFPFFEGENDHKLPTCDAVLLRSGVFKTIGMFMVHAAIHSGLAFVGLSRAVVEYLTTDVTDTDTPLTIGVDDLPSVEEREAIQNIDKLLRHEQLTTDEMNSVQAIAESCGFNGKISMSNCSFVRDQILYHTVIEKRQPHLDAMKQAFRQTPLLNFLKGRQYLLAGLFPSNEEILNQPDLVTRRIECEGDISVLHTVKDFITSECQDSQKLQALISAWTGWAILPEEPLKVKVVVDGSFCFHSCFQELEIPSSFSMEDIVIHLRRVLCYGSSGFGTM